MLPYTVVDEALINRLEKSKEEQRRWLLLEPHIDFPGQWQVNCLNPTFFFDLEEAVGPYRVVSPSGLEEFLKVASEYGYQVAFFEDPMEILDAYRALKEDPEVSLNSDFEGTTKGFLPFQVQGFNFLKDLYGGVAMWSTGCGKTPLATALFKYHAEIMNSFDTGFFVVKAHNKTNTQRALKRLGGLEGQIIAGIPSRRRSLWEEYLGAPGQILVINYEKFRDDFEWVEPYFENRRVMICWDEMPTKLKTRTTQLYESIHQCMYTLESPKVNDGDRPVSAYRRPSELRQYMLSATPIENSPEDFFNCLRLLDPTVYGPVTKFRDEYVARYNYHALLRREYKPEAWHKLEKMGLAAAHITHQVDKEDPDIAKQFPDVIEEDYYVDWNDQDRKIYDKLADLADDEDVNPLALITVLQMFCDAPSSVENSAAVREAYEEAFEAWIEEGGPEPKRRGSEAALRLVESLDYKLDDDRHTKLDALRHYLTEVYPEEKTCVFSSSNNSLLPILASKLDEWDINYVWYTGTAKQKQAAEDAFMDDPDIQVFLSSDQGSDSLDLYEGSVVIHYNMPWKWSTKIQRQNRINRVASTHKKNRFVSLLMADSIEDRRVKIIEEKYQYHLGVFKGAIADQSASARMTREDLLWILRG